MVFLVINGRRGLMDLHLSVSLNLQRFISLCFGMHIELQRGAGQLSMFVMTAQWQGTTGILRMRHITLKFLVQEKLAELEMALVILVKLLLTVMLVSVCLVAITALMGTIILLPVSALSMTRILLTTTARVWSCLTKFVALNTDTNFRETLNFDLVSLFLVR